MGGANCVQNTRSAFAVPRPSPASRRLKYAYCKQREAGQGPGKEASSAWCERLPESFSTVVFYTPQHHCMATKRAASRR